MDIINDLVKPMNELSKQFSNLYVGNGYSEAEALVNTMISRIQNGL